MTDDTGAAAKKDDLLRDLMERKLELAARIHELEAEIARINIEMQKQGAQALDLICW